MDHNPKSVSTSMLISLLLLSFLINVTSAIPISVPTSTAAALISSSYLTMTSSSSNGASISTYGNTIITQTKNKNDYLGASSSTNTANITYPGDYVNYNYDDEELAELQNKFFNGFFFGKANHGYNKTNGTNKNWSGIKSKEKLIGTTVDIDDITSIASFNNILPQLKPVTVSEQ